MGKSKELLFIRYISIFILLFQVLILGSFLGGDAPQPGITSKVVPLVFILMLIINNHLRVFHFEKQWQVVSSIILEVLVVPFAHIYFGGTIVFYLIGASIDIFTLSNKVFRYILGTAVLTLTLLPRFSDTREEGFIFFGLMSILFILLSYISRLYSSKREAQHLYDKLRVSEDKLIKANDELEGYLQSIEEITLLKERNRISREIHDSVGHALSTAMIQLSAMETVADKEGSNLKPMAGNLRAFINESFQDVKGAVRELKPDEYDDYQGLLRLQEVCNSFEKLSGVRVKTILSKGDWNLTSKQSNHLYRITQEVLSNSLRHGKATEIKVVMNFTKEEFVLSFNDNGVGTDKIEETGMGLKNIRERAAEIEAFVDMKSSKGRGFFVKVIVPREKEI
ncbi:MAG: sensor histidine kinase [Clostridium sp.]